MACASKLDLDQPMRRLISNLEISGLTFFFLEA